jgi:rubredoxin
MVKPEEIYQCQTVNCGCLYNPEKGDRKSKTPKGTHFKQLPEEWNCPVCGATKKSFRPCTGPGSVKEEHR